MGIPFLVQKTGKSPGAARFLVRVANRSGLKASN